MTAVRSSRPAIWLPSLVAGGLGLGALLVLFAPEAAAALRVWRESTAFGHCFLILPIALWLAWDRRGLLADLRPLPLPAAGLLVLPCLAGWLLAERLGLMEGRQLTALATVWVLVLALFGTRVFQAMACPLLFLVFLVPFGAFLTPALQGVTAWFIDSGLQLLAIPHYVDQYIIDIPEGRFDVAEACAGLRFLIAAIAFGVVYALVIYRSPGRRIVFIAVSTVVPVIANGFRALGIVVLGHLRGSAEAGAVDHVLYGWIFFSLVIALLVVLGLPFREDGTEYRRTGDPPAAAPGRSRTYAALACTLALACAGPLTAAMLNGEAMTAGVPVRLVDVALPTGCKAAAGDDAAWQRVTCGPDDVWIRARRFRSRVGAGPIEAELQAGERTITSDDVVHSTLTSADGRWRLSRAQVPEAAAAASLWRHAAASPGGFSDRLALARASLVGGADAPTVTNVVASGPGAAALVQELAARIGHVMAGIPVAGR